MPLFNAPAAFWQRIRYPLGLGVATALAWFLCESLIYRSGFYYEHLVEPQSNSGAVVMRLARVRHEASMQQPNVLIFGDSRIGEGFSKPIAEATAPGLDFINVGVPGSTPRVWFYLLRGIQREGLSFDTVVVGVLYRPTSDGTNWPLDPVFMAPLVDLRDARTFPASFQSPNMRWRANEALWLPGLLMQKDTQALFAAPLARRKALRGKRWWIDNASNYEGRLETMPVLGFTPDGQVADWGDATPEQREVIESHWAEAARPVPERADAFLGQWLGRMLHLTRAQGAKLVVYPLPRGPYATALPPLQDLPPALAALANEPDVTVLPADFLADLEAPEYFFDTLHANRDGRQRTSGRIAAVVARLHGMPHAEAAP